MLKIILNLLISQGITRMFLISKNQWMTVGVSVVVMLALMYAIHNADPLDDFSKAIGLDD
ncbi:hypothetical protein [Vibrio coralliilyticus]|uniref:hypothetical protein n=1 Tax=Vibrio coralliilyticus TaxID=190893 RepID=UPI00179BEC4E|nr:hypothetical protein [Vibrio coralliilyticus]NUW69556.1 hypothetical protein [Vibrio coralliilyticus]